MIFGSIEGMAAAGHIAHQPSTHRTISVVEDNPVLSDGIRNLLEGDRHLSGFLVKSERITDLLSLDSHTPDIAIVDPWQQVERKKVSTRSLSVLAESTSLIAYCTDFDAADARALGLIGFRAIVPKTVGGAELVRIVCAVAFGGVYLHEGFVIEKQNNINDMGLDGKLSELTEREIEVLRQVALGSSMKEIAALLQISAKTADTYKTRANKKLNLTSRSDIVRFAISSGWLQ